MTTAQERIAPLPGLSEAQREKLDELLQQLPDANSGGIIERLLGTMGRVLWDQQMILWEHNQNQIGQLYKGVVYEFDQVIFPAIARLEAQNSADHSRVLEHLAAIKLSQQQAAKERARLFALLEAEHDDSGEPYQL